MLMRGENEWMRDGSPLSLPRGGSVPGPQARRGFTRSYAHELAPARCRFRSTQFPSRSTGRRHPGDHSLRSRHSRAAASAPASLPSLAVPLRVRLDRTPCRMRRIDPLGARPLPEQPPGRRPPPASPMGPGTVTPGGLSSIARLSSDIWRSGPAPVSPP
jgi:hypothetical protein